MYHQTGSYDANATREAQTRLQGFQGASAISSKCVCVPTPCSSGREGERVLLTTFERFFPAFFSMYFGRDEDEAASDMRMEESILSANGFGNLETSARDAVRQIMDVAGIDDLSDVQNAIRTGAMRVSLSLDVPSLPFAMRRAVCPGVRLTILLPNNSSATSSRGTPETTRPDARFIARHISLRPDSGNIAPSGYPLALPTGGTGWLSLSPPLFSRCAGATRE